MPLRICSSWIEGHLATLRRPCKGLLMMSLTRNRWIPNPSPFLCLCVCTIHWRIINECTDFYACKAFSGVRAPWDKRHLRPAECVWLCSSQMLYLVCPDVGLSHLCSALYLAHRSLLFLSGGIVSVRNSAVGLYALSVFVAQALMFHFESYLLLIAMSTKFMEMFKVLKVMETEPYKIFIWLYIAVC